MRIFKHLQHPSGPALTDLLRRADLPPCSWQRQPGRPGRPGLARPWQRGVCLVILDWSYLMALIWLVVEPPLRINRIESVGMIRNPIGCVRNVPNHQPVMAVVVKLWCSAGGYPTLWLIQTWFIGLAIVKHNCWGFSHSSSANTDLSKLVVPVGPVLRSTTVF